MTARTPARILLTHTGEMRANYFGTEALARLETLGEVVRHEGAAPLDGAALAAAARGCRVIVADRATALPADVIDGISDTVAICRVAVDIRNIDVAAASRAGILVCQASRTWVPAVAEMAVGLMIDVARGVSRVDAVYKQGGVPEARRGRQLHGATAGVIGYGPLGRAVAALCRAFGMRVLVCDPYVAMPEADRAAGIEQADLDTVVRAADFLLPLAVATPETENLVGRAVFQAMKPGAYLVNLSRGNLVDEAALEDALDSGRIAGAALDVGRAPDQMPSLRLARRADVVATPHTAGLTREAVEGQALEVAAQVAAILDGTIPAGAVNAASARRLARLASMGAR